MTCPGCGRDAGVRKHRFSWHMIDPRLNVPCVMAEKHPSMCECVRCCDMDALRDNPLHGRERAEWLKSLDPQRKQRERW